MTAQIFDLRGQPVQPAAAPSRAGPLSGQLRLASAPSSPEDVAARRMRARMRLRNAIDLYRDEFGSRRLADVLVNAAQGELRLIEDER
jgi:hypothetical protein